jgi:ligand-binding sensor domain-containing protein
LSLLAVTPACFAVPMPPAGTAASAPSPQDDMPTFFHRFTKADGISQSPTLRILQDRAGFLWIGTENGLFRYDGYTFVRHASDRHDPGTLSENLVIALAQDARGRIWVGTWGGLNVLDPATGRVTRFQHDPARPDSPGSDRVQDLAVGPDGRLWIATRDAGLDCLDPATGRFTHFRHDPSDPRSLGNDQLRDLAADRDGRLWVASRGGLDRFDPVTGRSERWMPGVIPGGALPDRQVTCVTVDPSDRVWFGTIAGALYRLDPRTGRFDVFRHDPSDPGSLVDSPFFALQMDSGGSLWVATQKAGLERLDPATGRCDHFLADPGNPQSLPHPQVQSLFEDRSGILWVGTFAGLAKLEKSGKPFHAYLGETERANGLSNPSSWAVYEDRSGVLWVGTDGGGLNRRDPATGRFTAYRHRSGDPASLSSDSIQVICEDLAGRLWLGTYGGGVNRLDPHTGRFTRYRFQKGDAACLSDDRVYSLLVEPAGTVLMGSAGGLDRIDPASGQITHLLPEKWSGADRADLPVFALCRDGRGRLWVGTNGAGLYRLDPGAGTWRQYRSGTSTLAHDTVFSLYADRRGTVWTGTVGGLCRYDEEADSFRVFTRRDGLPGDEILSIQEDDRGRLWLGGMAGLARFDPAAGRGRVFDRSDGLLTEEFIQGAAGRGGDGRLYFGTAEGLQYFRPDAIRDNPYMPPVVLTSFTVFNTEMKLGQPLEAVRRIELNYRQSFFAFEFAALSFMGPEKNRYRYRLEGVDEDWVEAGRRRYVAYTNVDPGTYTFQVRAANNDGIWNPEGLDVAVHLAPPFWKTVWFRVLAVLGFIVLSNVAYFGVRKVAVLLLHWRRTNFISHFQLMEKIGRGGMGTVYRVRDLNTQQIFAMKVMNEEILPDTTTRQRFLDEWMIGDTLQHPNAIRVFEKGEIGSTIYFTMEYFKGWTLAEVLARGRPKPPVAVGLMAILFEIIHEIHACGIVHRDLKPGNIMIAQSVDLNHTATGLDPALLRDGIRILDFGIARYLGMSTLTQTGMIVGTLRYMPPENLAGRKAREAEGDFYALGAIFYELLTGRAPYATDNLGAEMYAMAQGLLTAPADVQADVPSAVSALVMELIRPNPDLRLRDYETIRSKFDDILAGG